VCVCVRIARLLEQASPPSSMDHESLRTASSYLNNLLLARGLLRNSDPIDFVKPSKESRAQIINLVHDQILREDRAKEQREHVAITLRNMRADEARQKADFQKMKAKREESARAAVQAQAGERGAKEEVKRVERAMKSLQEQVARLKTSLAQVRTQCANDVRKRDLELARLKTHLQGQQRGNRVGVTAPSISFTNKGANGVRGGKPTASGGSVLDLGDPEYSLKQETTEFLTQLSQSLSDENDGLIGLIRGALGTLKEVLGLSALAHQHPDSAIGSMGSDADAKHDHSHMMHALPTSYETLAAEMDTTLSHLKNILNNPSFVTVEEVEVREEEIARLREGWERMEQRWRDVLLMMDGWRRRMDTGDTIKIEDLRRGMGMVSPERPCHGDAEEAEPEQSFVSEDASEIALPEVEAESSILREPPPSHAAATLARSSSKRKRGVLEPPESFDLRPTTASRDSAPASPDLPSPEPELEEGNYAEIDGGVGSDYVEGDTSEPHLTIAEKLHAAQTEAEEAAACASSMSKGSAKRVSFGLDGVGEEERDDTLGTIVSPVKKTRIRGRPKRRKSTLSPEELEALMMVADG